MRLGDAFSEQDRQKLLLKRLQPFHVYLTRSSRKAGAPKYCLLICVGPCLGFYLNSDINMRMIGGNEKRRQIQVFLPHGQNVFLPNPAGCYVDCSQVVDSSYDCTAIQGMLDGSAGCRGEIDADSRAEVVRCVRESIFLSEFYREAILNFLGAAN